MIGEDNKLHDPCSEESFGHFPGGIEDLDLPFSDLFPDPPDFFQLSPPLETVETRENPGTGLRVTDLGSHTNEPGSWRLNQYNRIELTLDRNCLPLIVHNENWCKGNSKTNSPELNEPYLLLSVYAIANTQVVKPCRQSKCPSTSAGTVVQITSSSQLLDVRNDPNSNSSTSEIKVRALCIPYHHTKLESFSLRFVIKDNNGNNVCSATLDIGRPTANRSKKRTKNDRGFHNPPLGLVLVLIKTTHFTFRTNWRAVQH